LVLPLLSRGLTVTLITWGAMVLELLLFMALLMPKRVWGVLLIAAIAFHAAIAAIHGLISFSLVMTGALILYLRPTEKEFCFRLRARASPSLSVAILPSGPLQPHA
jgi:hypothetical protein